MLIDAHQHFWNPDRGDYGWLSGPFAPIRRIFTPDDLSPELAANGVNATVLVQTWSSVDETRAFLTLASATPFIAGVVGWVDLTAANVADVIAELKAGQGGTYLVGIRHQVHDEPDADWLLRPDVRRGLQAVADHGLVYDLLLKPRELPAALKTVQAFPHLRFVIDHIAKPDIRGHGFSAWAELMAPFAAERGHVWCKLSGMVTEADWENWTLVDLQPYIDEVLRLFGPSRVLYGSDWPVCRVAGGYTKWLAALKQAIAARTAIEHAQILGGSAQELYRLSLSDIAK
ncbi:L-fuconolactonase [Rhizomicrobium palustre]|uniref:L-fuconolactonase n=1 Tax=Rhizomicrobium palustre TaxID=189966 RepID=A0A846MTS3_9PROT|nr:amidohydrolase family protein [Rhizomicrobium palustre]NIK86753.1 L-fuconolactonase [Rhizomicrobium palustre]